MNRFRIVFTFLVALLTLWGEARAGSTEEDRLKAAFLYNFARFIEWPAGAFPVPDVPLMICVLGDEAFSEAAKSIEGKLVNNHKIGTRFLKRGDEIKECHILFVNLPERDDIQKTLKTIAGKPVLTVSDNEHFLEAGGMIQLISLDNKIRFNINLDAARLAGLQISSKLLKLAEHIEGR